MCGICGFIGHSKNPALSFRLITALFEESQIRGIDAAGYWGTVANDDKVVYHKEPIKATEFVKKGVWKNLIDLDLDLLLVHARGASTGVGLPSTNKNNHPFTSSCKCIGLVHNGRIPDAEYDNLKKKYEVSSNCDSEILLRIFEGAQHHDEEVYNSIAKEYDVDVDRAKVLVGLRDIWSLIDRGHMAVAIGQRIDNHARQLAMFRNHHRTLWLVDVREELGQVFFCSTGEIWKAAFTASGLNKVFKKQIKLIELPTEEIWLLQIDDQNTIVDKVKKFEVVSKGKVAWEHEGEQIKIAQKPRTVSLITKLDSSEDPIVTKKEASTTSVHTSPTKIAPTGALGYSQPGYYNDYDEDYLPFNNGKSYHHINDELESINKACEAIVKLVEDLQKGAERSIQEGRLRSPEVKELLTHLESVGLEIEGSIRMLP